MAEDDGDRLDEAAAEIASLKRENKRLSVRVHDLEVQQSVMRESFAQTEAMREQAEAKVGELKDRLHRTAHILIERVGADGPENADDVAERMVEKLDEARSQLAEAREKLEDIRSILARAYWKMLPVYEGTENIETAMLLDEMKMAFFDFPEVDAAREGGEDA